MKFSGPLLTALVLTGLLCGCGQDPAPTEATGPGDLLLVDTRPPVETTLPETRPAPTLPEFIRDAADPTISTASTEKGQPTETAATEETVPMESKPRITKQPTGETVKEGADAWFVAHAEGAKAVRWRFLSAENLSQSPEHVAMVFPDTTVEGLDSDTLILKNVSYGMSGWSVQAEFTNDAGTAVSEAALLTVLTAPVGEPAFTGDLLSAYAPVLENCKYILRCDPVTDSPEQIAGKDPFDLRAGLDLMGGGLGYALRDLDGNGTAELILGVPGTNGFGEKGGDIVYALFTLSGGQPLKLLQSWTRNRHYLAGEGRIYRETAGSAADSSFSMLRISGTHLTTQEILWTDGTDSAGNIRSFYSPSGAQNSATAQSVSDSRFYAIQSGMIASRLPVPELTDILAY